MKFDEGQVREFATDGFIVVREMFNADKMGDIQTRAILNEINCPQFRPMIDHEGRQVLQSVWTGHSAVGPVLNSVSDSAGMHHVARNLLGGEVYEFSNTLIQGPELIGGQVNWHQDYAYWYEHGVLKPDLVSGIVAINRNDSENGAVSVLRGSHQFGRLDHSQWSLSENEWWVDQQRFAEIYDRCEQICVTLEPGDCLFYHANTLHFSGPNLSDRPRWSMIATYNRRDNYPKSSKMFSHYPL